MKNITVTQNADFLSIALEELEARNYESAKGFIEDVEQSLSSHGEEELSESLCNALSFMDDGERVDALMAVEEVYGELINRL
jgi:hypothetical protein